MLKFLCRSLVFTGAALLLAPQARSADVAGFGFQEQPGQYLDILQNGKIVGRYMDALDLSTGEKRALTYKPYLHVFDAEGRAPITKGPGGEYTHHRGIMVGWMKIGVNGKSYDRWHMKGGEQVHKKFTAQEADADHASFTSLVEWQDEAKKPLLEEERTMTFRRAPAPAYILIDLVTKLKAVAGDTTLDGDPEHAGIQFRPANEVDRTKTTYIYAGEAVDPHKKLDLPWIGETFSLNGKLYSAVEMNHPGNPTGTRISAYRNYGRFGFFPKTSVKAGDSVTLQYRFVVAEGGMLPVELIQKCWNEYTGKTEAAPQITVRPAEQPAPSKPKPGAAAKSAAKVN